MKRVRHKRPPLSPATLYPLRDEHTRTLAPARAFAAEALTLEGETKAEG